MYRVPPWLVILPTFPLQHAARRRPKVSGHTGRLSARCSRNRTNGYCQGDDADGYSYGDGPQVPHLAPSDLRRIPRRATSAAPAIPRPASTMYTCWPPVLALGVPPGIVTDADTAAPVVATPEA